MAPNRSFRTLAPKTGFSNLKEQRRYWEIDGFAKIPCGGTHVRSTAEVGSITLKRINIGGRKERVEIKLVDDSIMSYRDMQF